ncbi:MAG TPA: hypothetical protein VM204_07530 [Gaiellaceae bacterium]|nr:hypothetical protein [Gaiellaceae bacterium]
MSEQLPILEREIHALLAPPTGPPPTRENVEHTLTSGYAHALRLEGERLRAEGRLRELVRGRGRRQDVQAADLELSRLDAELRRLRALLATLRARL